MKINSSLLETIVFISGAVVMILEMTGSRILAPYVGGSLPVWTGLIGIILGSLSLGYVVGGKLADRNPTATMLAFMLFAASIFLGIIPLLSKLLLPIILNITQDIRVSAVFSTILLFGVPSVLLGTVSPYAIRLRLEDIKTSGETAGRLYALSTVGSIIGTFLAGFFLIAYLGSHTIFYLLALIMFFLSCITAGKKLAKYIIPSLGILLIFGSLDYISSKSQRNLSDTDTNYNRVLIYEKKDDRTGEQIREMLIGNERSSAMFLKSDDLVYDYTKYYRLVKHFVPEMHSALMIGGAGYSYPKDFMQSNPKASMDVVEIDPTLTELAKEYFSFKPNDKMHIIHEDARTYLNRTDKQYDAILNDAFSSHYSHPFQLATKEALQHMNRLLAPDGVIITNTISSIEGDRGNFLRAEYATYKEVFPYVYVFPVTTQERTDVVQNIMIVAAKKPLSFETNNEEFKQYLSHQWKQPMQGGLPILTDDYAPVEQYAIKLLD